MDPVASGRITDEQLQALNSSLDAANTFPTTFSAKFSKIIKECIKDRNQTDFFNLLKEVKETIVVLNKNKIGDYKTQKIFLKTILNELININSEKNHISTSVEKAFLIGNFEESIEILTESYLRYSEIPSVRSYYYGELVRLYAVLGKCQTAQQFIEKQTEWMDKLDDQNVEKKFEKARLSYNKSLLFHRRIFVDRNNPYDLTALSEEEILELQRVIETLKEWKNSFSNYSNFRERLEYCKACQNLISFYSAQKKYMEAVDECKACLEAVNSNFPPDQMKQWVEAFTGPFPYLVCQVRINMGDLFQQLGHYKEALECYESAIFFTFHFDIPHAKATCLLNQGFCRYRLLLELRVTNISKIADNINLKYGYHTNNESDRKNLEEEERQQLLIENEFQEAIKIFSSLERNLEVIDHKVQFFNLHDLAYISFENYLYAENKKDMALEISQSRRARALKAYIAKKNPSPILMLEMFPTKEMQQLAEQLKTVFMVYSLAPCQLKASGPTLRLWVISSTNITTTELPIPQLDDEIHAFSNNMRAILGELRKNLKDAFLKVKGEVTDININDLTVDDLIDNPTHLANIESHPNIKSFEKLKEKVQLLKEAIDSANHQLEKWSSTLIPVDLLQNVRQKASLTIIPEGGLAQIPFAALKYSTPQGPRYIIEDFSISIAQSIQFLSYLNSLKDEQKISEMGKALVIYSNIEDDLFKAPIESENTTLTLTKQGMKVTTLSGEEATYEEFFKAIKDNEYEYIHLICHGTDTQALQSDSIFKGALSFKSVEGKKYIYGDEIAAQKLLTDTVFLSSCFSGRGKIHQEGNVGLSWAFLCAGATSVISCHWPLYDTDLTLEMVNSFYLSLSKDTKNKSKALQNAILNGLKNNKKRPDKWGLFYICGL